MTKTLKMLIGIMVLGGLVLIWTHALPNGVFAKDSGEGNIGKKDDSSPKLPAEEKRMGPRPPAELEMFMQNPKIQEELKRHEEVMKPLMEQVKAIKEKIRANLKSKAGDEKNDEGKPPMGQPGMEAPKPDDKILEPYKAEAEQIAGKITAEFIIHHQNLSKIAETNKENVIKNVTGSILMPPMPGHMGHMRGGNDGGMKPGDGQNENPNPPKPPDKK
jgi:hypothetical protein